MMNMLEVDQSVRIVYRPFDGMHGYTIYVKGDEFLVHITGIGERWIPGNHLEPAV